MATGLDLARQLADYGGMDSDRESADRRDGLSSATGLTRIRPAIWAFGLLGAAIIVALAFSAYREPELLLNIMGLRYCG